MVCVVCCDKEHPGRSSECFNFIPAAASTFALLYTFTSEAMPLLRESLHQFLDNGAGVWQGVRLTVALTISAAILFTLGNRFHGSPLLRRLGSLAVALLFTLVLAPALGLILLRPVLIGFLMVLGSMLALFCAHPVQVENKLEPLARVLFGGHVAAFFALAQLVVK